MWKRFLTITAVTFFILAGCSPKEQAVGENEEVSEPNQEEVNEEVIPRELPYHFPLTGIGSAETVDGRAIAVMVNNHPKSRPQSGLYKADIVYEILAEGNVTRFLAIFQSEQPDIIGSVRSAREYYIELAKGYDSLYIAHGNSSGAKDLLDRGYIDHLNGLYYDGTLFERESFRDAPHNSYISFKNILKGAEQNNYEMENAPKPLVFLTEDEVSALTGDEAEKVSISYFDKTFSSTFEYDTQLKKYKRFSNGEQTIDYDTQEPVLVDNVFIVEMKHRIIDSTVGLRDIDLTSGGRAYLLQKGQKIEVEWKNVDGRIVPYANGEAVGLVPGKTWINVIPTDPGLEQLISFE
ncbi:DUF3048 domain-containing protein [Niallia endozanthoxylica]|uniref:DUF3048 domain-containing protein n=1 Tax=Niallia endozanthoxylica TaxID=2036016 RepID=A0A5J5HQU8_9BACI|nr:DUF3048 domain-containing protein [Niallia endozanthoxylica]KAA9024348.1 DUF3048 domain-containing protein [Niallia endozanthoxylica]